MPDADEDERSDPAFGSVMLAAERKHRHARLGTDAEQSRRCVARRESARRRRDSGGRGLQFTKAGQRDAETGLVARPTSSAYQGRGLRALVCAVSATPPWRAPSR
jgi:hypothetical protein